jgi:hypothetical protein
MPYRPRYVDELITFRGKAQKSLISQWIGMAGVSGSALGIMLQWVRGTHLDEQVSWDE